MRYLEGRLMLSSWLDHVIFYLKLKMPGPNGNITIDGDRYVALECEDGDATYAESACAEEELKLYKLQVDPEDMTLLKKPATESKLKFKSA